MESLQTWPVISVTLPGHIFGGAIPPALLRLGGEEYSVISWNETMDIAGWNLHLSLMKPDNVDEQRRAKMAHASNVMREAFSRGVQL